MMPDPDPSAACALLLGMQKQGVGATLRFNPP